MPRELAGPVPFCPVSDSPAPPPADGRWYALVVRPNHEKAVDERLRGRGLAALCPSYQVRRRWSDRAKIVDLPLFRGYVFCHFSYGERIAALSTPGVRSVVSFGPAPEPIPEEEIEALQSIHRSGVPAQPWPYLRAGRRVRIVSGCLEGLEGRLLREKDLLRVVVSVDMLMRSVAVEVDRETVLPI